MPVFVVALLPKAKCCCICVAVVFILMMRRQLSCLVGDTFAYKWDSLIMHQLIHGLNVRLALPSMLHAYVGLKNWPDFPLYNF